MSTAQDGQRSQVQAIPATQGRAVLIESEEHYERLTGRKLSDSDKAIRFVVHGKECDLCE